MFTEIEKFLVFMSLHEIPNKKQEKILELLDEFSVDEIMENGRKYFSEEEYESMLSGYDKVGLERMLENMQKKGIKIVTVFSKDYPKSLLDLPDRPLILYAKGDLSLLKEKCLAIVGTRVPSNYGKLITEKFAKKLAESGFVIVSGLCYGVDEIAHKSTLAVGGKTIAIIGSGFNKIYPSTNETLAKEISEKGLLLSEYPPSFQAKKYTFPKRNRIVAGVCDGVLITEAGIKSGTVHTKEFALEYGKDVFSVPGNITNSKSELTNHLIKTAQAECVLSPDEIIQFYGMTAKAKQKIVCSLSFDEQKIVELLENEEHDFDFLAEKTQIPVNILNSCLTTLEIRGLIRKLPAQMYALI